VLAQPWPTRLKPLCYCCWQPLLDYAAHSFVFEWQQAGVKAPWQSRSAEAFQEPLADTHAASAGSSSSTVTIAAVRQCCCCASYVPVSRGVDQVKNLRLT